MLVASEYRLADCAADLRAAPLLAAVLLSVLTEGIGRMQRPWSSRVPSGVLVSSRAPEPSLNPEKLKALWLGSWHAGMINVAQVGYNDTLDIACCVVVPQEEHAAPFQPASILLEPANLDRLQFHQQCLSGSGDYSPIESTDQWGMLGYYSG